LLELFKELIMISRRAFLKLAGLSTVAFTTGIKIGEFVRKSNPANIYLTAFLPENDFYLNFVIQKFIDKVESIERNEKITQDFRKIRFTKNLNLKDFESTKVKKIVSDKSIIYFSSDCIISIQNLDGKFNSDIFLRDNENSIYHPEKISDLFFIRDEIRNQPARIKLICEYRKDNFLNKIIPEEKNVIVEVENEIVEKLPLNKNYKNVSVTGANGKVQFSIENQRVSVINSSCRNKLCIHSGPIENINQNIVCAPNKLIIRIDNA